MFSSNRLRRWFGPRSSQKRGRFTRYGRSVHELPHPFGALEMLAIVGRDGCTDVLEEREPANRLLKLLERTQFTSISEFMRQVHAEMAVEPPFFPATWDKPWQWTDLRII